MSIFFARIRACVSVFFSFVKSAYYASYGAWRLSLLPAPRVTIFGGSKIAQDHPYALQAMQLAQKCADAGLSVLTGGGPGIMQAANCGAVKNGQKTRSMGIGVKGLDEDFINQCVKEVIFVDNFFTRKWLLTSYSDAFAVLPGGFGTLDEMATISTLMQTAQRKRSPIVMIGVVYWRPLLQWIEQATQEGLLKEKDTDLITVTDDLDEAFAVLSACCTQRAK